MKYFILFCHKSILEQNPLLSCSISTSTVISRELSLTSNVCKVYCVARMKILYNRVSTTWKKPGKSEIIRDYYRTWKKPDLSGNFYNNQGDFVWGNKFRLRAISKRSLSCSWRSFRNWNFNDIPRYDWIFEYL